MFQIVACFAVVLWVSSVVGKAFEFSLQLPGLLSLLIYNGVHVVKNYIRKLKKLKYKIPTPGRLQFCRFTEYKFNYFTSILSFFPQETSAIFGLTLKETKICLETVFLNRKDY